MRKSMTLGLKTCGTGRKDDNFGHWKLESIDGKRGSLMRWMA